MVLYIYISVSVSYVQPHFFSIGYAGMILKKNLGLNETESP